MKIGVYPYLPEDRIEATLKNAAKVGLDQIEDVVYSLHKIGEKNASSRGYPTKFRIGRGYVSLIGTDDDVWIYLEGLKDWFKTSPVLKVTKLPNGYALETKNSFYELIK
jgi:hypothetical protein